MSVIMSPAEEVVARLNAVYGDPKTPDPGMFVAEYIKALTGFDGRVLHKAADRVIKSSTFWPKPAELIAEAEHVASEFYRHRPVDGDALDAERRKGWGPKDLEAHAEFMAEWKRVMSANVVTETDDVDWEAGLKPAFGEMQHASRNVVHRK
jgi:hypothetical protein